MSKKHHEYTVHIRKPMMLDRTFECWCGAAGGGFEFLSLNHVVNSRSTRLLACSSCVVAAIKALEEMYEPGFDAEGGE